MHVMRSCDDIPVPAVFYAACPMHPQVLLPQGEIAGETHLCWECAQENRRVTYAQQLAETVK
jgi:hypothetical protein